MCSSREREREEGVQWWETSGWGDHIHSLFFILLFFSLGSFLGLASLCRRLFRVVFCFVYYCVIHVNITPNCLLRHIIHPFYCQNNSPTCEELSVSGHEDVLKTSVYLEQNAHICCDMSTFFDFPKTWNQILYINILKHVLSLIQIWCIFVVTDFIWGDDVFFHTY